MPFPPPDKLEIMADWCRTHRGAIARIAALVVKHDGTRGINHSAVTRTLAGRERNSLVIKAYRKHHAAETARTKSLKKKK